ncbi:MAG: hypothetical protein ACYS9X_32350 [Planctomycetota bacterium]|jgi:hypothetical protein
MSVSPPRKFLSVPPLRRLAIILVPGAIACAGAYAYRVSRRPKTVPADVALKGTARVREVTAAVGKSDFGGTARGSALTSRVERFVEEGRLRFSAELDTEALYRKERGCAPVLYVGVYSFPKKIILPTHAELAERLYHESLHAVKRSGVKTYEEECDAYCAAEEARAAVEGRAPSFPVRRDGQVIWDWVKETYKDAVSDRAYVPVGQAPEELARKAGVRYRDSNDAAGPPADRPE